VRVEDPRVLTGVVQGDSGDLALLVNSSGEAVEVDPVVEEGAELALAQGGLELGPFEVATVRLSRPGGDERLLGVAYFPVSRLREDTDGAADDPLDTPDEGRDATA
jgi:hypothetical protein